MATVTFALAPSPYLVEGARVLRVYMATRPTKKHIRTCSVPMDNVPHSHVFERVT